MDGLMNLCYFIVDVGGFCEECLLWRYVVLCFAALTTKEFALKNDIRIRQLQGDGATL